MTELTPEARALLEAVRAEAAHPAVEQAAARVHAALQAKLTAGAAGAAGAGALGKWLAAKGLAAKGLAAVALAAVGTAAVGTAVHFARAERDAHAVVAVRGAHAAPTRSAPRAGTATGVAVAPLALPAAPVVAAPVPTASTTTLPFAPRPRVAAPRAALEAQHAEPALTVLAPSHASSEPTAAIEPALQPAPSTPAAPAPARPYVVDRETMELEPALAAIRDQRPREALALLDQYAAHFPNGALHDVYTMERIDVLCALDRLADAHVAARAFLSGTTTPSQRARVNQSCGMRDR